MELVLILEMAFTAWMLVDAHQRKAQWYWYIIIMLPFCEVAYYLAVKVNDAPLQQGNKALYEGNKSLQVLMMESENCPSLENRIHCAQKLYDQKM